MSTLHGIKIKTDGTACKVAVDNNWEQIAGLLNCSYIERVRTPIHGLVMIVDESGLLVDYPQLNPVSYSLYLGPITGDVLLVGEGMTADGPDFINLRRNDAKLLADMMLGTHMESIEGLADLLDNWGF